MLLQLAIIRLHVGQVKYFVIWFLKYYKFVDLVSCIGIKFNN